MSRPTLSVTKGRGTKPFARDFGVPPDDAQDNFTDPESRIMKTSGGYDQCDNGQIAVDAASQMIVATGVTNCAADHDALRLSNRCLGGSNRHSAFDASASVARRTRAANGTSCASRST
jgi:hypothetical protein